MIQIISLHLSILSISDLPTSRPHIYGLRSVYDVGALLNLSCESGPSSPPPRLHWFLNGVKMGKEENDDTVTEMEPVFPLEDKRGISRSLLKYPLSPDNLARVPRQLVVKCVAVIKEFYRKGVKVEVEVRGRQLDSQDQVSVKDKAGDWRKNTVNNTGTNTSNFRQLKLFFLTFTVVVREF